VIHHHQHLIVRAHGRANLDCAGAKRLVCDAVSAVEMKLAEVPGNPMAYDCQTPGNEGVTVMALIEESHCVLHSWPGEEVILYQFDLYSCRAYDATRVIRLFRDRVDAIKLEPLLIDRTERLVVEPLVDEKWRVLMRERASRLGLVYPGI